MPNLEDRVAQLEKSLRFWRLAGTAVLSGMCLLFVGGAAFDGDVSDVLKTRLLVIVDESGKGVMHLQAAENGPELAMVRKDGKAVMQLKAAENGPELVLSRNDGKGGTISLRCTEDLAVMRLGFGKNDKRDGSVKLGCGDDGNGVLAMFRRDGKEVWSAP